MSEELALVALQAQLDQLTSHLRDAVHISNVKALGVICPSCGSKVGRPCYGNGPMAAAHEVRFVVAQERVREILLAALAIATRTTGVTDA